MLPSLFWLFAFLSLLQKPARLTLRVWLLSISFLYHRDLLFPHYLTLMPPLLSLDWDPRAFLDQKSIIDRSLPYLYHQVFLMLLVHQICSEDLRYH